MKRIIEILLRLVAPPARLVALLFAVCATSGVWATDSLEETGGFITDTSTLAFKGVSLSELTADTLSGRFGGAGAGTASGTFATFNNFDRSSEGSGSISCEAQVADDGWVKGVILTFTQSGEDVYVVKTAGKYKSGSAVGPSVSDGTSENSSYPYAIYNLALPRTGYGAATVVWEKGQFGLTKTGTDGNSYSFSNIDGTDNVAINASGAIEVSSGATKGAIVTLPSGAVNVAVLVKYSGLATKSGLVTPVGMYDNASPSHNIGIRTTGESTLAVKGYYDNDSNVYPESGTLTSMPEGSGYFLATYNCRNAGSNYFNFYAGSTLSSLAGGSCTSLRFTHNSRNLSSIAVGGPTATDGKASPWDGLVIEKVAIFVLETNTASASSSSSPYTNTDVADYYWPSAKEKYSKFSYISAARRLTWTTASTVTGDIIANASTQYTVFDIQSGDNTATTYDSGTASGSKGHWHYVCYSTGAGDSYAAPGSLLRFVGGEGYAHSLAGSFSPLTLGGIIVEEGATGYSFAQNGSRYSIFGDPTNTTETYFDFYEDFTNARNAGCHLDGTINITVASGKTFTIAGTTTKCSTSIKSSSLSGTAGGTLKLHGGGHLAATLTASDATLDYTDLPTTVSSSSDAYIQGTLTVNSGTVIALPAGATFPYYVATGISGSLNVATGVTIGGAAAPYYQANATGYIEYVAPSEVTISSDATWGSGDLAGWATDDSTKDYIINVTADATLTLPSAVSCKTIVFNVSDGVTLTVSGSTLTAADGIEINGARGAVAASTTAALSGSLSGNGVYWLKNATLTGFSAATIADEDLTLRLTGCTGYFNGNTISPGTLDLQDDGNTKAFTVSNCSSSTAGAIVFAKLTGSGTFTASNADVFPRYAFTDPSSFTGTFAIPTSVAGKSLGEVGFRPVRIILGTQGSLDPDKGSITVVSDTTATIAAGKTWTAPGGIEVDGTLNLGAGATAPKLKSGSDGMVVVASGTATVSGIDSSAISPTLGIVGTLAFADTTTTELTLTAEKLSNGGTLDLSGCTAVTTMNLVFGSTRSDYMFGTITPPPNLATVNVTVTEVLSEDGVASLTIPASLTGAATLNVTVTGLDGTTKTVTKSVSGAVLSVSYTPTVSASTAWCAYEFETSDSTALNNTGSGDTTALSPDTGFTAATSVDGNGKLYTYTHPYRDITYPTDGNWTAVVRCTVPRYENAAVITFGTLSGGLIGLVAGADQDTQMKLVKTTGNSAFTVLDTVSVVDAATAQHVYVFSVENNQTIKIYCDGEQVYNHTFETFTIGGGIQVGSVHGSVGSTGIVRFAKGESPANTLDEDVQKAARIDCVRLYKGVLGPNAIAQLSVEFPAVKLFQATIAGGNDNEWDSLSWTGGDIGTLNEYSKIILTVTDDATLTLPSTVTAEEFTINVTAGKTLTLLQAAGGTTFTLTNPIEVNNGSLQFPDDATIDFAINGTGTVRVDDGETLNFADDGSVPGLTGAGTLDCSSMSALPGAFAFNSWTGTVKLPSFSASSGVNFNSYGTTGSTVALAGMTDGYILEVGKTVAPTLQLNGDMSITAMSSWTYTFAKIIGSGNLSFSTSENTPTINITSVNADSTSDDYYSGTISNTTSNKVTIDTLTLASSTSTTAGTKLYTTGGGVQATSVVVGEETFTNTLGKNDGIYLPAAISVSNVTFDYYATYTNADVTATISDSDATYSISVNGGAAVLGTVSGNTVTFEGISGFSLGDSISYTITAAGTSTGTTDSTSTTVANSTVSSSWMLWDSTHTSVGSWSPSNPSYSDSVAALNGTNIYTAAWTSTGEVVTVNTSVKFGDVADQDLVIDADAQAAIKIGSVNSVNTFQLYTGGNWEDVYNDTLGVPDGDDEYAVTIKLDYTKQKYGVSVANYGALTNATGGAEFALARNASQMQKVSYIGAGSFKSLSGSYISAGYTADVGTEGSATNVVVSSEFVNNYMSDKLASQVSAALSPKAERNCNNGLNYFESYALGLAPTDAEDKPLVDVTTDADGKFVVTLKDKNGNVLTPAANVALKLTMKSGSTPDSLNTETEATSGAGSAAQFTINPADMGEATVKYYKVKVDIGAK